MGIKSFIYLDDSKMYSFSSQLFEGVTQYILSEQSSAYKDENQQKGSFLSGRFMADMMFQQNASTTMRYLHDFAFNLFEHELMERSMLYDVTSETTIKELCDKGFVRIKGKILFEDYSKIIYTLENFNELGRAIANLQNTELTRMLDGASETLANTKDREQKHKKKQLLERTKKQIEEELIKQGLIIEDSKKDNLLKLMKFGYRNSYAVQLVMENSGTLYTAIINQKYLKEAEQTLISKYSRLTEKEFTIIGVVTQCGNAKACVPVIGDNTLKNAMVNIFDKMAVLEEQFDGRTQTECIIDPIAIFTEV